MKIFLLLVILNSQFLIFNSTAQSPNWQWAKGMGGTQNDRAYSITVDASGNVYTTGTFSDTADFDPGVGVFNLTGGGTFISKLDVLGNFIWAKAIGGPNGGAEGRSITIDPAGNGDVYTTGNFNGTGDFDPGAGVYNLTPAGLYDIFILKLDSSGNFVWAKALGGTDFDYGNSIAFDPAGSGAVYTTGPFEGTADFDPGAGVLNLTSAGGWDIYISKLDNAGNFLWAKAIGAFNNDVGLSIAIDPAGSGYVYTTGPFTGTVDFDPGAGVFNLTGGGGFISKLDNAGNFVWAKAIGGVSSSIAIETAGSGEVYTTGSFNGTVDFDPGAGVFNLTGGGGFISKLDTAGNFVWAKATGGGGGSIAIDTAGSGDVYTAGYFNGTVDFDPGVGVFNLSTSAFDEIFISKLDSSGNFAWAKAAGGIYSDQGFALALDGSGNVLVTGEFNSPSVSFGSITLTNAGAAADIFIARLDTAFVTGIDAIDNFNSEISIYPNPFSNSTSISFSLSQSEKVSIKIFDVNGRLVEIPQGGTDKIFEAGENEIVWNAEDLDAGIYFLRIVTATYSENQKVIVAK